MHQLEELLRELCADRELVRFADGTVIDRQPEAVGLVRSLAFVQAVTAVEFSLPPELEDDDLRTLREAEALLRRETVSSRWADATLGLITIDTALLGVVEGGGPFRLEFVAPVLTTSSRKTVRRNGL